MDIEIETKLKVRSLEEMAGKLAEFGGEFKKEVSQTDYYIDDAGQSLAKTDRCLRIRRERCGQSTRDVIAFKGRREESAIKQRQEIEIKIDDAEVVLKLFSALGYEMSLAFEKRRKLWRLDECEVCLDQLPLLGAFVEIEGPSEEKIASVQKKLGLSDLLHIRESYAELMREELGRRGIKKRVIFFEPHG